MMRAIGLTLVMLAAALGVSNAFGHGSPILITATPDKKLHTDKQVYNVGSFELLGGVLLTTDQPGYSIVNASQGVANGTLIQVNVIDQLLWWQNGVVRLDSDKTLTFNNPLGDAIAIDKDTVFKPQFGVEFYDNSEVWHEHLDYILTTSAPVGAYGVLLQLTAPGYVKSDNFLVVLNNGLSGSAFNTAAAALAKAEFQKPGDATADGIVDIADYTVWADNFLKAATWRKGNFNYDGVIDIADYTIWADNFAPALASAPAAAQAVPEPATVALAAIGSGIALLVAVRRRRRQG